MQPVAIRGRDARRPRVGRSAHLGPSLRVENPFKAMKIPAIVIPTMVTMIVGIAAEPTAAHRLR